MSENSDREQWAQVPGVAEIWVSDEGQVATHAPGGGFDLLNQYSQPVDGKPYVFFAREEGKIKGKRFVARLVLNAFVGCRPNAQQITHADGDPSNVDLKNLSWREGGVPLGDLQKRRCLGTQCGHVEFLSSGPENRMCARCSNHNKVTDGGVGPIHFPGEIPRAPDLSIPPPKEEKG